MEKTSKIETDITKDDLKKLGSKKENLRNDGGDDKFLKDRQQPVDFSGSELDIPGRSLPSDEDTSRLKDEENQLYSQGGEENKNLEEHTG